MPLLKRVWAFFAVDRAQALSAVGLLVVGVALSAAKPWPLALLIDRALATGGGEGLGKGPELVGGGGEGRWLMLLVLLPLVHVAHAGVTGLAQQIAIGVGLRGLKRLRLALLDHLLNLGPRFFHTHRPGDVIARASWDAYAIQTLFQQGLINGVTALLSLVVMFVVMLGVNPRLSVSALGTVVLLLVAINLFSKRMRVGGREAQEADSRVTSGVQRLIQTLPLVLSYVKGEEERRKFDQLCEDALGRRRRQHGWELAYAAGVSVAFGLGLTLTVGMGVEEVRAGRLTAGGLWVFLAYLSQWYEPLNQLSHAGVTLSTAAAGAERVFEILDTPAMNGQPARAGAAGNGSGSGPGVGSGGVRGEIVCEDVSFGFSGDRVLIRSLNLRVAPGERIAIMGPSGSGKTSFLMLLARFLEPTGGTLRVDGVALPDWDLGRLRRSMAIVFQDAVLIPGTILDNILYGREGATEAEAREAARRVGAHDFIEALPDGYRTVVGDGAQPLSAGERQRLQLTRAFLKDAPILLLDEPTSALDREAEQRVMEGLAKVIEGKTVLWVTHREPPAGLVHRIVRLQGEGPA